ncbi:hypothetical protein BDZ91DRAFT_723075 [Kalaharituber pfeilii]|nr:hypothetical protein BDZ91DRAFT_723075 [Kalaharituber pfeilii]
MKMKDSFVRIFSIKAMRKEDRDTVRNIRPRVLSCRTQSSMINAAVISKCINTQNVRFYDQGQDGVPVYHDHILNREQARNQFAAQYFHPQIEDVHHINQDKYLPAWDLDQPKQPHVILGPLEAPQDAVARVVHGIPVQYQANECSVPRLTTYDNVQYGLIRKTINELHALQGNQEEIQEMKFWALKQGTGTQLPPAGLSPALNYAAEEGGGWEAVKEASQTLMAAGNAVSPWSSQRKPFMVTAKEEWPNLMRRPPNAWIIYRRDYHKIIAKLFPGMRNTDISKIIARMWQEEKSEVKMNYKERSDELAQMHKMMNPNYKFNPRKAGERKRRATRERSVLGSADVDALMETLSPVTSNTSNNNSVDCHLENINREKISFEPRYNNPSYSSSPSTAHSYSSGECCWETLEQPTNDILTKMQASNTFYDDLGALMLSEPQFFCMSP